MQSTTIYSNVFRHIHKKEPTIKLIPKLTTNISSAFRVTVHQMNPQQILAQVYNGLLPILQHLKVEAQQIQLEDQPHQQSNSQIDQDQENSIHQDGEDQASEENINEMNQGQNQMENQDDQENQENDHDNEDQDQDQDIQFEEKFEQEGDEGEGEGEDEELIEGEDDVGLYGQQLDEEEMEDYQNEGNSEEDREFEEEEEKIIKTKKNKLKRSKEEDLPEEEDIVENQFEHFREVQLQNMKEEKTEQPKVQSDLEKTIDRLQNKILDKKGWVLKGQVKATERPVNSLLEYDLQFSTGLKYTHQITEEYNEDLDKVIKQRILDQLFDDRVRYVAATALREHFGSLKEVSKEKSKQGLAEIYQLEFKNYLGLGENKGDRLKKQIMDSFKEVNYYLDSLSNFNFTPKPMINSKSNNKSEAIISEEKVPLTMWNGMGQDTKKIERKFESEKEVDNHGKRLKNKRISRTRMKEQAKKKLNKKIQYGGVTKFEAQARKKIAKNSNNATATIKYNQSAKFFKSMNQKSSGKPNQNISKLKI